MKLSFLLALCCITTIAYLGCNSSGPSQKDLAEGEQLYRQYCILCHGEDGKLQLNGAMDITQSQLTIEERIELMKNGRNLMTPFEGILTEDQMRLIANYAITLKEPAQ
ncbi:MAG: cytochrome c [Saprospiraceae bacterium]|nr:cytochrome c [Saprospiraceae bacterium]